MVLAVEQVKRMRGGAQSHLMRCANGGYYVVKFQNNPQGLRILANELLATRLARRIGLPSPEPEVVEVRDELIAHTEELVIQLGRGRALCTAGKQFGSRYPGEPANTVVYDFLPDEQLRAVENLDDFCGVFVFDKWTCNTNGQAGDLFSQAGRGGLLCANDRSWLLLQCVRVEFSGCAAARIVCAAPGVRAGARD